MFRVSLRSLASHKARLVMSTLSIVLGVAFIAGTLVFSDTINAGFSGLFTATTPDLTVTPTLAFTPEVEDQALTGEVPTLPAGAVASVAAVPGVAAAYGDVTVSDATVVDAANAAIGPTSGAPTLAHNWYSSPHSPTITRGRAPAGPAEIVVDATSAARKNVHLGDALRVITPTAGIPTRVVGLAQLAGPNPGVAMVYLDTATAQNQLAAKPDSFTSVTVDARPGVTDTELRQHIGTALGPNYSIATKEEQAASGTSQISAFLSVVTDALLAFAGIAVVVGIFLILNTFSMLVAQRTRELGLLRALGASRRQVTRAVLVEGLVVGALGATVGLGAGIGLAAVLRAAIGDFGVDLSATSLVISPLTVLAAYTVGVGVTVIAAYVPARRGSRISPMAALREATTAPSPSLVRRSIVGGVLLAASVAGLVEAGVVRADKTTTGAVLGAGVVGSLIAAVVLAPLIAQGVVRIAGAGFPLAFGAIGRLSQRNALRNPRRTGATAAALMIGLSLVGATAVLAASLTTSIDNEVDNTFGADYVISGNGQSSVSSEIVDRARAVRGVDAVTTQRYALAHVNGAQLALSGVDVATIDRAVRPQYTAGSTQALARGELAVDETTATADHWTLGSPLQLTFANGASATLTVGAISKPPTGGGKDGGVFQVSTDTLARYVPTAPITTVYLNTAAGADGQVIGTQLDRLVGAYPQVRLQSQADYRNEIRRQVDTVLYLIYGLLALAIAIAVLGVINTLALSVIERTREIGLLRAIGTSRRQLRRLIRLESVLISTHGAILGLGLGLAWGAAAQQALRAYGVTALTIPWATISAVVVGAVVVGLIAALLPSARAARLGALTAIAVE
jgi:putative ABC transport system permease protein